MTNSYLKLVLRKQRDHFQDQINQRLKIQEEEVLEEPEASWIKEELKKLETVRDFFVYALDKLHKTKEACMGINEKNGLVSSISDFIELCQETPKENECSFKRINYISIIDAKKYVIQMQMARFDFEQDKVEDE